MISSLYGTRYFKLLKMGEMAKRHPVKPPFPGFSKSYIYFLTGCFIFKKKHIENEINCAVNSLRDVYAY